MGSNNSPRETDVVVLGGGPVGENAAGRTAAEGLHTTLVEHELLGGECSYWACMPSKALLRPGEALAAARQLGGAISGGELDVAAVLARRDSFTSNWDDSSQVEWVEGAGVDFVRGHGRLVGERAVEVTGPAGTVRISARHAVIVATGSTPVEPPVDGLADLTHWGSREATSAHKIPPSLAVLGGGVVGVEMAQAYANLGSQVVLVAGAGLLARAESFAGELVADSLREQGVTVHVGPQAKQAQQTPDGVRLTLDDGTTVDAATLLVATGRRPATADIGVETVGLTPGEPLAIDDQGVVDKVRDNDGAGWLYAVGDVNGRAPLTHQGKHQARIAGSVVVARSRGELPADPPPWSKFSLAADHAAVPQVVFTDPQVAWVGRTAKQATEAGLSTRVVDLDIAVAGSSVHRDGYTGKARFVVDTDRGVLVGVTFVGPDVAELLHSATIAVVGEVPLDRLWHAVPSFPTISEVWLRFLEQYGL
ncbi:MAG: NAD(P)/FAD-dependent oxidoreductase [Nocardioidaceae bacterium]|nr:NAD(P)/FAD-dependent oxidoreductase [Nocardioidaceae bacterium]